MPAVAIASRQLVLGNDASVKPEDELQQATKFDDEFLVWIYFQQLLSNESLVKKANLDGNPENVAHFLQTDAATSVYLSKAVDGMGVRPINKAIRGD